MKTPLLSSALALLMTLALPKAARANCADQHDALIAPKMNALIQQSVVDLFKKKGIALDPANVAMAFTTTGFSTNFEDPEDKYVVFGGGGSLVSASGTKFYLDLSGPDYDKTNGDYGYLMVYEAVLTSNGFDNEGNAINPHCTLKLAEPEIANYATSNIVKNSTTDKAIGTLPLPAKVSLY